MSNNVYATCLFYHDAAPSLAITQPGTSRARAQARATHKKGPGSGLEVNNEQCFYLILSWIINGENSGFDSYLS